MKVGDLNSTEKGSAARASSGKTLFHLVPFHLFSGCARVLEFGLIKYKDWNWSKGMVWSECINPIFRHLFKWWFCGEDKDPESGEHHLDHVLCNVLFLIHYSKTYKEGDDRPPKWTGFEIGNFFEGRKDGAVRPSNDEREPTLCD